jgi:hypothetical protein
MVPLEPVFNVFPILTGVPTWAVTGFPESITAALPDTVLTNPIVSCAHAADTAISSIVITMMKRIIICSSCFAFAVRCALPDARPLFSVDDAVPRHPDAVSAGFFRPDSLSIFHQK